MTTVEVLRDLKTPPTSLARPSRPSRVFAKWMRWLHIYLSMISFSVVLFFSATGITLNHPGWFGGDQAAVRETTGTLDVGWVAIPAASESEDIAATVSRLEVVEHLRREENIRGAVGDFTIDEYNVIVTFRAPAYSADVFIDRETGEYDLVESSLGLVALVNDLHKGRDAGAAWSWLIDASALLMVVVSLTGFSLIFYIKRHRIAGLLVCTLGAAVTLAAYSLLSPH